ncbi:4-(cytidine 5'-diphospho)-2-C-methyl-D-erythritol kinase [Smaragdicoccus niigatensis]
MTVRAPAKVNLFLAVDDLRPDGFHDLVTVFQALSIYDEITVRPSTELSVSVKGEGAADVPTDASNLVWKAAEVLAEIGKRDPEVDIHIDKSIPVAGGMAGGSADCAAALVGLNALWRLDLSRDELHEIGAELGSDVPFALQGGTAIGTGRGEKLLPVLSRNTFHWVLALAKGGLSTPSVFHELDRLRANGSARLMGEPELLMQKLVQGDVNHIAELIGNDLQSAALSLKPELRRTLRAGQEAGALAGIVSGSGPTCAFLCQDAETAIQVSAELAGAGVCRSVRVASGPVHGARIIPDYHGRGGHPS